MSENGSILLSRAEVGYDKCYTVTLAPGDVRYMRLETFFRADVNVVVAEIEHASASPTINAPSQELLRRISGVDSEWFDFWELGKLLAGVSWPEWLRVHHAIGALVIGIGMPSWVYYEFHRSLKLARHFAVGECDEAWMRGTAKDWNLAASFIQSPQHLVIQKGATKCAVFLKTSFVQSRLDSIAEEERRIAEETARKAEQARAEDAAQRSDALTQQLRRSRFTTFVYLMEDVRNGAFKIGRSRTPGKRERTLQSEVPETLLRFSIPAEEEHEKALHSRFSHRRIRGEWFELTHDDLVEVIAFLKTNGDPERATVDFQRMGMLYFRASGHAGLSG